MAIDGKMERIDRAYYSDSIASFRNTEVEKIIGQFSISDSFMTRQEQRSAWIEEVCILQEMLRGFDGEIYFEYSIPRMGKRVDVLLIIGTVIFILEFKIGQKHFLTADIDQVWDYALDMKYFHSTSHDKFIAPILLATHAAAATPVVSLTHQDDNVFHPIMCTTPLLPQVINDVLMLADGETIDVDGWETGRYCPTPTIIEAAMAMYRGHSVKDISRSDASAINLSVTSDAVTQIINDSKTNGWKSICFVTGVPGAGKTLVGLNIATQHIDKENDLYSVFLSGNAPLVAVLREALTRDKVRQEKEIGHAYTKAQAFKEVKMFIQNVHNFRDECLIDNGPPIEHVALFDEAQRAWDLQQTRNFMARRKKRPDFQQSEPAYLISCMNRWKDWATIVCLVGGGQEINTGEAGISEWIRALNDTFSQWRVFISSRLHDSEYGAGKILEEIQGKPHVAFRDELHLSVSMRSFRAENVSLLVKQLLDLDIQEARATLSQLSPNYPIVITRHLIKAKQWLKKQARGSERFGILVSSQAERLKPHAIDVKSPMDPIHWFLEGKDDVRSSYYLEDVATEFHVQGLELDWACVTWDGDFKYTKSGWEHRSFCGNRWNNIKKAERKMYLKNAYRVLLTRARQGMVIVVPHGDETDGTRKPEYYDPTFEYLQSIGFPVI